MRHPFSICSYGSGNPSPPPQKKGKSISIIRWAHSIIFRSARSLGSDAVDEAAQGVDLCTQAVRHPGVAPQTQHLSVQRRNDRRFRARVPRGQGGGELIRVVWEEFFFGWEKGEQSQRRAIYTMSYTDDPLCKEVGIP